MDKETFEWMLKTAYRSAKAIEDYGGGQMVDGEWYMPKYGNDTLQFIKDVIEEVENRNRNESTGL